MKQTLSLKIGQQLAMTPQLQQAIRLLQLSSLDLQQEISEIIEANPMLELDEEEPGRDDETADDSGLTAETSDGASGEDALAEMDAEWEQPIPEDLPVDTSWDDVYPNTTSSAGPADGDDWNFDDRQSSSETLQEHLLWQLNLAPMSDVDRFIGTAIIDAIDNDGMLTISIEELTGSVNPPELADGEGSADAVDTIEEDEVVAVLKRIQQFDPTGVGARDLPECLSLQLRGLGPDMPWQPQALNLVNNHLDLLAA
jgi:RNA polymerase sigma-54 factor